MSRRKRNLILTILATDKTFERSQHQGKEAWIGKCIHCNRHLVIGTDGQPISRATIEHIIPRHHGGTDDVENLALACARCNTEKGIRHDIRKVHDPKLHEIIGRLKERRQRRWRHPAR